MNNHAPLYRYPFINMVCESTAVKGSHDHSDNQAFICTSLSISTGPSKEDINALHLRYMAVKTQYKALRGITIYYLCNDSDGTL